MKKKVRDLFARFCIYLSGTDIQKLGKEVWQNIEEELYPIGMTFDSDEGMDLLRSQLNKLGIVKSYALRCFLEKEFCELESVLASNSLFPRAAIEIYKESRERIYSFCLEIL